ncbi:MAG TPA: dihydroneopterin aldolase [Actinomycetota bacterium]|nr:dihydroneopterin aldolase [Actinomycetota bacterium]
MTTRLFLTGIGATGRHGAKPGEKDAPQDFVVDLDVQVAVDADALDRTADYRGIIRTARGTVESTSFDLLESLAAEVARAVSSLDGVVSATAIVHKPAAARSSDVQGVAAAFTVEAPG